MRAPSSHAPFPWPPSVARWLWSFLGGAGVALIVAFAPLIGAWLGLALAQDVIDRWLALMVPVAATLLGLAFGAIAWGIAAVNRGRDGRTCRFLLPSRAGVIESGSPLLVAVFVTAASAFAMLFGVSGVVLTLRALA